MKEAPHHNPAYFSIYHDTRKENKEGRYPVKLRVYHNDGSNNPPTRLYSLKISLTKNEFKDVWGQPNPRGKNREWKDYLENILNRAKEVGAELSPFSIKAFKERFFGTKRSEGHDVFSRFEKLIEERKRLGKTSTAEVDYSALKSFKCFLKERKGFHKDRLDFDEVDKMTLEEYETWMTEEKKKAIATVGTYTRHLRLLFNHALEEGLTESMPFGRRRYKSPNPIKNPKNLSKDELKRLSQAETKTNEESFAKDLFLLSFLLYGINIQDLFLLKHKNLSHDERRLSYYRQKTMNTAKQHLVPTVVSFGDLDATRSLIKKYWNPDRSPEAKLFDFGINLYKDKEKVQRKAKNKLSTINRNLKRIAKRNGLPEGLSWNWARHTFVTLYINEGGATIQQANDTMAHRGLTSTDNYRATIEEEEKVKRVKVLDELLVEDP